MQKTGESEWRCGGSQGTHSGEGGKSFIRSPGPQAGDSAGNPSRVNRDTWVPARESRERDRAEGLFQAARELQKEVGVGGWTLIPDTPLATLVQQLGNALEEIR